MTKQQAYQTLKNILGNIDTKLKVHQEMQQMLDMVYSPEAKVAPITAEEKKPEPTKPKSTKQEEIVK